MILDPIDVPVPLHAPSGVGHRNIVSDLLENLPCQEAQLGRRLGKSDPGKVRVLRPVAELRADTGQDHDQESQGDRPSQRALDIGVGDHLGRGRFASRQRGRQGIASRQRSRHGQRRHRALARIRFEALQDDPLDRIVETLHPAGHTRLGRAALLLQQLRRARGLVGSLTGEQLVEHQAKSVDVGGLRHLLPGQLLRSLVGRSASPDLPALDRLR